MNISSYFIAPILRRAPNALILVMLCGLGYWGHRNHWRLPGFSDAAKDHRFEGGSSPERSDTSRKSLQQSGFDATVARLSAGVGGDDDSGGGLDRNAAAIAGSDSTLPIIRFRSSEAVRNAEIQSESAQRRNLDEFVFANGVVEYDETRMAQLSPRVPGIAWRVDKRVGDHVRKGDVLAILDSSDVGKAKADFLEAVVVHDLKAENLIQLEKISNSVPARSIREARAEERTARVHLFNAQQALINLGLPLVKEFWSGLSDDELARRIQFLGIPADVVARFEPDVITANLIPLTAPFEGEVIDRELVAGEVAQTGQAQFIIADVSHVWLRLNVRKVDAARLAVGQDVFFASDGTVGEVHSRIAWVGAHVDEKTRTVPVRTEVENAELESASGERTGQRVLRVHTFGTARIRVREERLALVVPNTAIQFDNGRYLVFVPLPDGCSFQPRAVSIGITTGDFTEIIKGLAQDERVVTSGAYVLKAEVARDELNAAGP